MRNVLRSKPPKFPGSLLNLVVSCPRQSCGEVCFSHGSKLLTRGSKSFCVGSKCSSRGLRSFSCGSNFFILGRDFFAWFEYIALFSTSRKAWSNMFLVGQIFQSVYVLVFIKLSIHNAQLPETKTNEWVLQQYLISKIWVSLTKLSECVLTIVCFN